MKMLVSGPVGSLVEEFQENLNFSHPEDANFHNIVMEHLDWFAKRHVEDKMLERH